MDNEEDIINELLGQDSWESILDNNSLCEKLFGLSDNLIKKIMSHFETKNTDPYSKIAQQLNFKEISPYHPEIDTIYSMIEISGYEDISGAKSLKTVGSFLKKKLASVYSYQIVFNDVMKMNLPYLTTFGVQPDFQTRGVGTKTLDHFVENIAGDFPLWFTLVHNSKGDTIDWYKRRYPLEKELKRNHNYSELLFTTYPLD